MTEPLQSCRSNGGRAQKSGKRVGTRHRWPAGWGVGVCAWCSRTLQELREPVGGRPMVRLRRVPRRAGRRWMAEAPPYVLSCHDSGPRVIDRYTVLLWDRTCVTDAPNTVYHGHPCITWVNMSEEPSHPQGVSMSSESHDSWRRPRARRVRWLDFPLHIRRHIIGRWWPGDENNEQRLADLARYAPQAEPRSAR